MESRRLIPMFYSAALATTLLLLGACAARNIPPEIKQPPADSPDLQQVLGNADAFLSRKVRWGGTILGIENREEATWLTVLALPLDKNGEPQEGDVSPGRFIAVIPRFLEPTVYGQERRITVSGTLQRSETRKVGEFPYRYPVVQAQHYYIWPVQVRATGDYYRYPPWWYDPWYYDPWYHPFHRHRHLFW